MLQWDYWYITLKLKLKTIKNLLSFNGTSKQSRLAKYCMLNLLTLNEKDWCQKSDCMQTTVAVIKS